MNYPDTLSDYWKAVIIALDSGRYYVDLPQQRMFGPRGELKIRRCGKQGYATVRLHVSGLPKDAYSVGFYKVVAYLKFGLRAFTSGLHIRHRDGNSENNHPDNILLGTASQNEMDKPAAVRQRSATLARAAQGYLPLNTRLTPTQVKSIKSLLDAARSPHGFQRVRKGVVKDLAEHYAVSPSTISLIGKGKSWNGQLSSIMAMLA